jgi:hypothetical protein
MVMMQHGGKVGLDLITKIYFDDIQRLASNEVSLFYALIFVML